jgi:diaminopimelate epimerase
VNAARRGLTGRRVRVSLPGGDLDILWREDGHVEMTGPVASVFTGEIELPGAAA